jgi:hypothetical protein
MTQGTSGTFTAPGRNESSDSKESLHDMIPPTVITPVIPEDPIEAITTRQSHSPTTSIDYTNFSDTHSFVTAPCPESQISETPTTHLEPHNSHETLNNNTFFSKKSFNSLNKFCKNYAKVKNNKQRPYSKKIKITHPYADHFLIKVTLFFSDTSIQTLTMIDSGATGSFIDRKFVSIHNIPTLTKKNPYKLNVIDGCEVVSSMVTHNTTPIVFQVKNNYEHICFDITELGRYPVILGIPWLVMHNPIINWKTPSIKFPVPSKLA